MARLLAEPLVTHSGMPWSLTGLRTFVINMVNHDGDSDSTGAVAGNIIGAIVGYSTIPKKYIRSLELHDLLLSVADDLGGFSTPEQMKGRYLNHQSYNIQSQHLL